MRLMAEMVADGLSQEEHLRIIIIIIAVVHVNAF